MLDRSKQYALAEGHGTSCTGCVVEPHPDTDCVWINNLGKDNCALSAKVWKLVNNDKQKMLDTD